MIPTDINASGQDIEKIYLDIVESVRKTVRIPLAVKLGPYFSNMGNMAKRLDEAGVQKLLLAANSR